MLDEAVRFLRHYRFPFPSIPAWSLATFLAGLLVSGVLYLSGVEIPEDLVDRLWTSPALDFALDVVVVPLLETLLLLGLFGLLSLGLKPLAAAVVSALVMAGLHALVWWGWGVISLLPFLAFSLPMAARIRRGRAFLVSASMHGFHNLYVLLLSGLMLRFGI